MKTTIVGLVCISILSLPLSCAEMNSNEAGNVIGGSAGGIVGSLVDRSGQFGGSSIGAAAGALAGVAVGRYVEKKQKTAQETTKAYNYQPSQGTIVTVEDVHVEPDVIRAGEPSKLVMTYALLDRNSNRAISITETRQILIEDQPLKDIPEHKNSRTPGTYATEQEVKFPEGLAQATYTFKGTVEAEGKTSSMKASFRIVRLEHGSDVLYAMKRVE